MAQAAAASQPQNAAQQNAAARHAVLQSAIDEWQSVFTYTGTPPIGQTFQVPLTNVGIVKRLLVEFSAVVTGQTGKTYTLGPFGLAAFWSNITLTDLSNQQRINTPGWHLHLVNSAKARFVYGGAINKSATDNPFGFGANWTNIQTAAASIITSASTTLYGFLEIPMAYSDYDLRGAIFANVLNATFNVQFTINPNLFVASGVDSTFALYGSADATLPTLGTVTLNVYQNYLDQLPISSNGQYILPYGDLGVSYLWNWTQFGGSLVQGADNPFFYANFRNFMSTLIIYDNAGTLTGNGTDINFFALRTANYTNIMKVDPKVVTLWTRLRQKQDAPLGTYYFDHRKRPIATRQYGNQAMVVNPAVVTGSTSVLYFGYEMLANISQITSAGSLPGT